MDMCVAGDEAETWAREEEMGMGVLLEDQEEFCAEVDVMSGDDG